MTKPKVAFVTPGSFPIPSPGSSSVERVIEKMAPLLQSEVTVRIYGRTGRKLKRIGNVGGVRCERFPAGDKSMYIARICRAIRSFMPDIVQVENRPKNIEKIKKRYPNSKIWLNLHSTTFISPKAISLSSLRRSFLLADRIIVNSEFLREAVAERVPEAASKLRVVHIGVEPSRFLSRHSPEGEERRERLRSARKWEGRSVVLYMGRVVPYKGVHHLLRIMPRLIACHPDVLLVIVGSPFYGSHRTTSYSRGLQRLGKKYPHHVRFVPYVPYHEVPDWFLAADVAVVPSGAREAFGLVNVEAMACGIPVVASRAGGIKEVVVHEETGYLVLPDRMEEELAERLLQLLKDEELRINMGRSGRERIERQFTWENTARRWLSLLQEDSPT
ncbi:glycosyltransferase family 4 protein [Paenibacillus beijingensis]|uniref:Glycosyl transferase family 1 n=1 Tax=Paenibacillus beijingensis TaxID=1126833 RepID=A0A0D5NF83_9BACL|nr:glycosyltransferase family 4 protein [Paenibacillus beijingensis]AJY73612.1 glycosyl transferase family 1 [Paenibacillus beijingensis]